MWENERKQELIRNGIIGAILVALIAGLAYGCITVMLRVKEEDELLKQVQASQRQELSDARQESKAEIDETYAQHLNVLTQYLPGIVCWGDSLTTGSSGNVSYPHTLQKYLDIYISGIYDLRYSLELTEGLSTVKWDDYRISVPVINMGAGRENSATILGRSGVVPFVVSGDFVIPAGTESVSVGLVSESGERVLPLVAGDGGVNPVTIAGVQGTLVRNTSQPWSPNHYEFTRLEAGQEVAVQKGTPIVTASTDDYRNYIHIVWLGTYGDFVNADKLVRDTKALLQRQNINTDRYLVIGPCAYNGSWSNLSSHTLDSIDSAMLQTFGDRYINLRKYLLEDGLRDAGLSASDKDRVSIANGHVPDSFCSNTNGADLNGIAYELLGELVFERMDRLGYFKEVREALKLEKSIQEILKADPGYFENRLNAY